MGPDSGSSLVLTGLIAYRDRIRRTAMVVLILSVLALSVFGIVMLYSTSAAMFGEKLLIKQAQWIGVGILAALVIYFVDYRALARYRVPLLVLAALPLAYLATVHVLALAGVAPALLNRLPLVRSVNGAYRWLFLGSLSVQPGELAKLAIILFLAAYYGANPRWATQFRRGLFVPLAAVGPVVGLVLLGGSLSITVIIGSVVLVLLFVAGVRLRYFLIVGLAAALAVLSVLTLSTARLKRVTESWFNPEQYRKTTGYQLYHAQLAIGSGGWLGLGPNRSRLKESYLPEAHTDFIMAIAAEELGHAAIIGVMAAYLLLVGAALCLSMTAIDRTGMLLGLGIGFSVGIHALINLAVVSGALPTTGVTAPLVSYGGSSMLLTWLGIGLLCGIARVAQRHELEAQVTLAPAADRGRASRPAVSAVAPGTP